MPMIIKYQVVHAKWWTISWAGMWDKRWDTKARSGCACVCNPSTQDAEVGEWQVSHQPGLRSKTLGQEFYFSSSESAAILGQNIFQATQVTRGQIYKSQRNIKRCQVFSLIWTLMIKMAIFPSQSFIFNFKKNGGIASTKSYPLIIFHLNAYFF